MGTPAKILIGILTFLPIVGLIFFFIFYVQFMVEITSESYSDPYYDPGFPEGFWYMMGMIALVGLVSLGMTIFYAVHAARSKTISMDMRLAWILINVFGGTIAHIIYFFMHIATDRPIHPSHLQNG